MTTSANWCTDCLADDGRQVTCIFDAKHAGIVCPRCERVYSPANRNPDNYHYASKKAYLDRIRRDQRRNRQRSVSTAAMVSRILKPID